MVGKRIVSASAIDDKNVFGKVGTSGEDVEAALKGKKVRSLIDHQYRLLICPRSYLLEVKGNTSGETSVSTLWLLNSTYKQQQDHTREASTSTYALWNDR